MSNILFIDVETTGLDPFRHSLTEIAAEYHENGKCVKKFHKKIKMSAQSQSFVDLAALKATNTSLKATLTEGEPEDSVTMEFVDFLLGLNQKKIVVGGHNVHFDLYFLKVLLQRFRVDGITGMLSAKVADTGTLSNALKTTGKIPDTVCNLETLSTHLGITTDAEDKFHTAPTDVKVTAKSYYKMLEILKA